MPRWAMQFWQDFETAADTPTDAAWTGSYPATMPDARVLRLPLRDLGETAVAGLIANQASFAVLDRLMGWLAEIARPHGADIVVGLPTLGHVFGAGVARALDHANWVAPGTSRKLWYDEALSVPLASVTSPANTGPGAQGAGSQRRLWLDPRLIPRLQDRGVLLVDDVISTGASMMAALTLLRLVGVTPVAICAAMLQGERWRAALPADVPVQGVFATPRFRRTAEGWTILPGTALVECCPLLAPGLS